jgi:SNF2 family DNA or RNA helicase
MQIIDNKALLLRLRDPNKVINAIPKSQKVGDNEVIVNWGLEEAQSLNQLGIKSPSPIEAKYTWTGRYQPFDHQVSTASFLTLHQKGFCFNEQGTGKTASAIWASDFLMKQGVINRVLVVCPLSIMDSAWRDDLFTFATHRTVSVAHGSADKRKKIIQEGSDYVVINYDGIGIVLDDLKKGGFDLIIVDEATHYKNVQTRRWKLLRQLIHDNTWLWMMTGTPAAQNPTDAYGLAKLVSPNRVPRFFGAFKDMVMFKVSQFTWKIRADATDIVFRALQPAIRFTKDECLDLPPMVYTKRQVELTAQQKKYYKELKTKLVLDITGEQVTAINAAVTLNKLLQISAGAIYTDEGDVLEFDIKNRYKVLREVIDESSQKVLVFVPFTHAIDILTAKLRSERITTEVIRGDVPAYKRTQIFKKFQEETDPQVLVIQPQAASHGVTLTRANTVVWWGPTSSLETYDQANARVHRSGQTHKCTVVQLQGSDAEKHVYRLLDRKINVHTKFVELYKEVLD